MLIRLVVMAAWFPGFSSCDFASGYCTLDFGESVENASLEAHTRPYLVGDLAIEPNTDPLIKPIILRS